MSTATDETTMIGDTMETDILGGVQLGFHTVLVLSGGTQRADLPRYAYRPDLIVDSLGALAAMLDESDWRPCWSTETSQLFLGLDHLPMPLAAAADR